MKYPPQQIWDGRLVALRDDAAMLLGDIDPVGVFNACTVGAAAAIIQHADIDTNTAVGDLVHVVSGTGVTAGFYRIIAVGANAVTVDRNVSGAGGADIRCEVYQDVIAVFATDGVNGQRIIGYSHQDGPLQIGGDAPVSAGDGMGSEDVLFGNRQEVVGDVFFRSYFRRDVIKWLDCFDIGASAAAYELLWNVAALITGAGTNVVSTTPSYVTLTTGVNIADAEGTRSEYAIIQRIRENRTEIRVELGQTANTQFYFGWNTNGANAMAAAADDYVIVFFDVSDDPNWQIKVGDGTDEEVFTSAIAASTAAVIHDIWVETDGTVHWAINGIEQDITGSVTSNKMTAADHYLIVGQLMVVAGAGALTAEIDYVENEKNK